MNSSPDLEPTREPSRSAATAAGGSRSGVGPAGRTVRRARPIYRVFVSSTWLDLQPERRALMEALNRMDEMRFVGMEFFGNRPDDTHDTSIDQVDACEVFVGVIGFRYGSGITEAEYRRARELGLPCFVYLKREERSEPALTDNDSALAAKLQRLKDELRRGHTVKEFSTPEELAANATADLHNWVAAQWVATEPAAVAARAAAAAPPDADRVNVLRLLDRIQHDWVEGVLEASLHHRAWLELGLEWRESAVEHPWDRIVVAPNRPIETLQKEDSITSVFDGAQHTLLVLGEPGAGKTTTLLELARDLIGRSRTGVHEPVPVVLALSTWGNSQTEFSDWVIAELGIRYQVPKRLAATWLEEARLVLLLDGLDEVREDRRDACVVAVNTFAESRQPPGLAVTCRVAEYDALAVKLKLRAAICLQPLTPAQVDRYFAAAGAGLDRLRLALREDEGLRELARTPLMLSVMTLAWRDSAQVSIDADATPADRRRQLFAAYVQSALSRRGKATGGYSPEQTVHWLSWLAARMKENGSTLFAVEQLQPGWLAGAPRQLGYFLSTRLLGCLAFVVPFLGWSAPVRDKALTVGLGFGLGLFLGAVDFCFARFGAGGRAMAMNRFWTVFFPLFIGGSAWAVLLGQILPKGALAIPFGVAYLFMAGFAFCMPLDVRALDVRPTASIRWAWRQAWDRSLIGLVAMTGGLSFLILTVASFTAAMHGLQSAITQFVDMRFLLGLVIASLVAIALWSRFRPRLTGENVALAATLVIVAAQVSLALRKPGDIVSWVFVMLELTPAIVLGVFGGFASTMIDPTRGRNTGVWFWLRVPLLMAVFVGLVTMIPGVVLYFMDGDRAPQELSQKIRFGTLVFGAGCGLVAFFRFGGFNGVQHFFLRWLLVRSGDLPPKAEAFFNHAAQLALLQKVGFGYRFIHALLLEHLAERAKPAGK